MKKSFIILGVVFVLSACTSDVEKMAKNYEKHHLNISYLDHYASGVLNDSSALRIEINKIGKLSMFACAVPGERDFKWYDDDYKTIMPSIDLTQNELDSLILLLKQSKCIGLNIYYGTTYDIWYSRPRWGFDLYSYILLNESMSDSVWNSWLDYSAAIPYCDTVVFLHGGPAFGTDDIPKRDKKNFLKKHNIERR